MKNRRGFYFTMAIAGLFIMALVLRHPAILLIDLFFILYLVFSVITTVAKEDWNLKSSRTVEILFENGQGARTAVHFANQGRQAVFFSYTDPVFENMQILEGHIHAWFFILPGSSAKIEYTFTALRGGFEWTGTTAYTSDIFGFFTDKLKIEAKGSVFFHPLYKRFRQFETYPKRTVSSPGVIPTKKSGTSTDFFGIREYHPGDSIRKLDWKMCAKHPNKYFIREFEQESNSEIGIILDGRKNLNSVIEGNDLFEVQVGLAASLSEVFIGQGNRVGIAIAGESNMAVIPGYGKRQLRKILNALSLCRTGDNNDKDTIYNLQLSHFSNKAQLFFISGYAFADFPFYRDLRSRALQIVLITPDIVKAREQQLSSPDTANMSALRLVALERKIHLSLIRKLAIPVIDWDMAQPVQPLLRTVLRNAARTASR